MSAWIGPLGSLIEFKCPSAVESSSEDSHVYFRSLGGDVAVTRLGDGTRPRVWDVSVDAARPDHVAALQGLASGAWGPGPFLFIPPGAPAVNMLGKRSALSLETPGSGYVLDVGGAPVLTTEGYAGANYATTTSTPALMSLGDAPVLPGQQVTGKAWVQALTGTSASLRLVFYTAGGAQLLSSPIVTSTDPAGTYLSVTDIAPEGAAYARLSASGAIITHPQVTWTAGPRTWSPSAASLTTVVTPVTESVRRATGVPGQETITDHRFTVTELRA